MQFREPRIEFINLEVSNVTTTSAGSGYTVCEKINGTNIQKDAFCVELEVTGMSWNDICDWCVSDPSMSH